MKPSVDNKPPPDFSHLRSNLKKQQVEEERFTEIERNNRILLSRMSSIMRKGAAIDNKPTSHNAPKSLNSIKRKQELDRITRENQNILKRIQARKPTYSVAALEDNARKQRQYLANLAEFPVVLEEKKRSGYSPDRSDRYYDDYDAEDYEDSPEKNEDADEYEANVESPGNEDVEAYDE